MKKILKFFIGNWDFFCIYKKNLCNSDLKKTTVYQCPYKLIHTKKDNDIYIFSIQDGDNKVCSLEIIKGEKYKKLRDFTPLSSNEAKVIAVYTNPLYRGKGMFGYLMTYAESYISKIGIISLYARIWHSNISSRKAFSKNNWTYIGFKSKFTLLKFISIKIETYRGLRVKFIRA